MNIAVLLLLKLRVFRMLCRWSMGQFSVTASSLNALRNKVIDVEALSIMSELLDTHQKDVALHSTVIVYHVLLKMEFTRS